MLTNRKAIPNKKYGMVIEKPMPKFYFEVYNEEAKEAVTFENDDE